MPSYDRGEFQVSFKTTPGSTLEQTEDISNEIVHLISEQTGGELYIHHDRRRQHFGPE